MHDQDLKALWRRAGTGSPKLGHHELELLLRPTAGRSSRTLAGLVWSHLGMLAATLVCALAALPGYLGNPGMVAVEIGLALGALLSAGVAVRIIRSLRRLDRPDRPLLASIEAHQIFTAQRIRPWLLLASFSPWMLSFALITLVENDDGQYRINHPWEYALVVAVMLAITWTTLERATDHAQRELTALASDLRSESLTESPQLVVIRRRHRHWLRAATLLLVLGVLAGLLIWSRNS